MWQECQLLRKPSSMKLNTKQRLLEKISKMHTEYFVSAPFDFVVGIGVLWNIFLISDTMKFTQSSEMYIGFQSFSNRVNMNLGEFHETNVSNVMNSTFQSKLQQSCCRMLYSISTFSVLLLALNLIHSYIIYILKFTSK